MMREFVVDIRETRELSCTVWAESAEEAEAAAWDKYNGGMENSLGRLFQPSAGDDFVRVVKSSEEITNVTEYA